MARYFVFVEFTDPEVRVFLDRLRKTFAEAPLFDTPHVTVRGPYSTPPEPALVAQLSERLHGHGVLIADADIFKTRTGYAVLLHAKSKLFNEVWWKPDFSGPANRRLPHVTIYEGSSRIRANAVLSFLRSEDIEIVTYGVELTVYASKQQSLISEEKEVSADRKRLPPERLRVREGIFERAEKIAAHIRKSDTDGPQGILL